MKIPNSDLKEQKWEIMEKKLIKRKIQSKLLKNKISHKKLMKKNINLAKLQHIQKNNINNFFVKIKKLNFKINKCLNKYKINNVIVIYDKNIKKNVLEYINNLYLFKLEDRNNQIKKHKFFINIIKDKILNLKNKIKILKSKHNKNLINYFMFFNYVTYRKKKSLPLKKKEKKFYNRKLIGYFEKKKSLKFEKKKKFQSEIVFSFLKLDLIKKIGKKIKMNLILNNVCFEEFVLLFGQEKFLFFETIFKDFLKFPIFLQNKDALKITNYIFDDNLFVKKNENGKKILEFNIFQCIIKNLIKEFEILKEDIFLQKIESIKKVK